jgi:hypothetical protein
MRWHMKNYIWPILALLAVFLSQTVVFIAWEDLKLMTWVNMVIFFIAVAGVAIKHFENRFRKDVGLAMGTACLPAETVTAEELEALPHPVQNYLRYVGVVGKPMVKNVKVTFEGQMRDKGGEWFNFTSEQYNFFEEPARFFFMKARVKGLPVYGYHSYKNKDARMHIRLLSLYPVADFHGPEMFPTETVTFFNDICLFAPAALLDSRISWEAIGDFSAKATFTNMDRTRDRSGRCSGRAPAWRRSPRNNRQGRMAGR